MLGSHNSFSYLSARNPLVNLFKGWWKCQDKTIEEQKKIGVNYFDVRIFKDGSCWRVAHGLAELNKTFKDYKEMCNEFKDVYWRIWMEKGGEEDWQELQDEINKYKPDNLLEVYRKSPETKLFSNVKYYYFAYRMSDWKRILKWNPIKKWAEGNPEITQEMIDDPEYVYFMDYV